MGREERILQARKDDLDDEENQRKDWAIDRWVISRVDPFLKEVNRKHFEPRVISLGLFGRRSWNESDCGCGDTKRANCGHGDNRKAEQLKLDVAIKFITDIRQDPIADWKTICRDIVRYPGKMKETYEGLPDPCFDRVAEDETAFEPECDELECIQSALTLDAIFVTSLLAYFARNPQDRKLGILEELHQTFELISRETSSKIFLRELMLDIFKLENQIPLELIKETITIMYESFPNIRESDPRESDSGESDIRASVIRESIRRKNDVGYILQTVCAHIVSSIGYYFPSFRESAEEMAAGDVDFCNCHHLLHCLAHALWEKFWRTVPSGPTSSFTRRSSRNEAIPQSNGIPRGIDAEPPVTGKKKSAARDCFISKSGTLITATELNRAGITLKAYNGFFPKLEKNKWKGTLLLPRIPSINEYTEQMWRNLLAFEEPFPHQEPIKPFIHYLKFMDHLINTKEDVGLLCSGKDPILKVNQLGDHKEVADLFNVVSKRHTDNMEEHWSSLREEIMGFHTHSSRVTTVEFMEKYFSRPWLTVSLIVAFVILALSFLQALYGMLSYYDKSSSSPSPSPSPSPLLSPSPS